MKANWEQFQHLCSIRLHQCAITDADDPMSLFTSILKDIADKPWFTDTCKDEIKEHNRALERFKHEPTEGNVNAYCIARYKAHRDI